MTSPSRDAAPVAGEFLDAKRVALIGATSGARDQWSYNARMTRALVASSFDDVVLVSRREKEILGRRAFSSISEAPGSSGDLAVLVVPHAVLASAVAECAEAGWARLVAITGQLDDAERAALRRVVPERARLWGPNCTGLLVTATNRRVMASDYDPPNRPLRRRLAVMGQSGGALGNVAVMAAGLGMNISHIMSTGEELDLGIDDLMDHIAWSRPTDAIVAFVEEARRPERFLDALARCRQADVPVAIIKVGRSATARSAAKTHSGALVGDADEFDAAVTRLGGMICSSFREAAGAATLAAHRHRRRAGRRSAFFTSSGGTGALACDLAAAHNVPLATLSDASAERIRRLGPGDFEVNPFDSAQGGGTPSSLSTYLDAVGSDPGVDVTVVFHSGDVYGELVTSQLEGYKPAQHQAVLAVWPGVEPVLRERLLDAGTAVFEDPAETLRWLDLATGPDLHSPDLRSPDLRDPGFPDRDVHSPGDAALLDDAAELLSYRDASTLLRRSHIDAPRQWYYEPAAAPGAGAHPGAPRLAAAVEQYPVVVKAADLSGHKAELGGVVAGVKSQAELITVLAQLSDRFGSVVVEEQAPAGVELLVALRAGPFGGLLLIGLGGAHADGFGRQILLSANTEQESILVRLRASPVASVLAAALGADDAPAALDRVADAATQLASLAQSEGLASIEMNPLIVSPRRAVACDVKAQLLGERPAHSERTSSGRKTT